MRALFAFLVCHAMASFAIAQDTGVLPTDESGRPLNLDFESGTLRDWTVEGTAFKNQPVQGDTVHARRSDMHSRHQGQYWVGGYERGGDAPRGTLTSRSFKVTKPFASFLIAGGPHTTTRVELVRDGTGSVLFTTSGDESEDLKRVVVDLNRVLGQAIFIRLVDDHSGGWGHLNFDDFRLHDTKPLVPDRRDARPPADLYAHAGLGPQEAAQAMSVPPGFNVALFAGEPDVVQPIAFAIDHRGRLWVAEAYSYPRHVPDDEARDRILIFEDEDGDGRFDSRKVFAEKLNLVSGLEVGFGGAWVGAAPHLLFIPDQNGDDLPDGPPQVLLDGWGYQDTHETLNTFTWGPDGWLYGCHGVFTHSRVGKPGTPDTDRTPINAGIWRYHPTKHVFEVFAQGTSNPWGIDFDARGQCFIEACVIPHLFHIAQGGRYERQAGQHFDPYTYADIKTIADHRHYLGVTPHGGNGRSDGAGGGHAHAGLMVYLGGSWPEEYRGSLFMNNIHGARLNRDIVKPKGSGFVGSHAPDFLLANDAWSQIVDLESGPDGSVFMIDWYDKNQCHRNEVNVHDRTNGRIFKVSYGKPNATRVGLQRLADEDLAILVRHENAWFARHARRALQERAATGALRKAPDPNGPGSHSLAYQALVPMIADHPTLAYPETQRLSALWALHAIGELEESVLLNRVLKDSSPYMRAWGVQFALEDKSPSRKMRDALRELATRDPSPVVRLYLASALQRMPLEQRWEVLEGLVTHEEDVDDPNLPLMYWYAASPLAEVDASRAAQLAEIARTPQFLPFMTRRIASVGTDASLELLVGLLGRHVTNSGPNRDVGRELAILSGLSEALKGRRQVKMPAGWPKVYQSLRLAPDPQVRSQATALALTFGDPSALQAMRGVLLDPDRAVADRREALTVLLRARAPELAATLKGLVSDPDLRGAAIRGLAAYEDDEAPGVLLNAYKGLNASERRDVLNTLAARAKSARALLEAIGPDGVPSTDLTADVIRQLRSHRDKGVDALIAKVWGQARETSQDKAERIAQLKAELGKTATRAVNLMRGRAVFNRVCAQCHTLFGSGGQVGPELTGSNRADLDYLLSNVLDPSALIGKDYQAHAIATVDGRVLNGLIKAEDKDAITLITANETVTLPKGEIAERALSDQSMMPDDLLKPLNRAEVRDLMAYLAAPGQVPVLATAENVSSFFNGKDLAGWIGDPSLWSVRDGELVGKTAGLEHNEFLKSEMVAGDFRLTFQVKLVENKGNSGVQFRSIALPNGEMKGYQADIGPGWWGKLYEEGGRGLLWSRSGEAHVKPGEWNTYTIEAKGDRSRTWINGNPCVDLDDPNGQNPGLFALQLHSGGATEVRFKDFKLELLTGP